MTSPGPIRTMSVFRRSSSPGRPGFFMKPDAAPGRPPAIPQPVKTVRSRFRAVTRVFGERAWKTNSVPSPPRCSPGPPESFARP